MIYERKDTLISIQGVTLSFDGVPILKDITANVQDIVRPGVVTGQVVGILGPSGVGKCLARGTPVLMFNGEVKKVEQVQKGDQLMGPDGTPRNVLGLGNGLDQLYRIVPVKGDSYTVNSSHILPLKLCRMHRSRARYQEITVSEYLRESRTFKSRAKMFRASCIPFPYKEVPMDPYIFGLWLGDGDNDNLTITNQDREVVESIQTFALAVGAETSTYAYEHRCPRYRVVNRKGSGRSSGLVLSALRATGSTNNKHIPLLYKANAIDVRLSLLAGLLDSDGSLSHKCFDFVSKQKQLAEDVCYVARSLGFAAYIKPCRKRCQTGAVGTYYRVTISGDTEQIPVRVTRKKPSTRKQIKNVLHTGFSVENAGIGQYFGFELDQDGLFLLGDFTVSHNTQLSRILTGLQPPTTGSVLVGPEHKPVTAGLVGYVAQNYPLLRHRTVLGNLVVAAMRSGLKTSDATLRAKEYLDKFDLSDKVLSYPSQLSGGQRQRIAIAQQLLCSEHYLILDEPTTGLDPIMRDRVCDFIRQVASLSEENTIFVISHDIASVLTISDTLWVLGRVRDEQGKSLGATIVKTYDLIERGLAWQTNPTDLPAFYDLQKEVRALFETL